MTEAELNNYKGYVKGLFWGLLLVIFGLDVYSYKGISTKHLFEIAGSIILLVNCIKLKEASNRFKNGMYMSIAMIVYTIISAALYILFPLFEIDTELSAGAHTLINATDFRNLYINIGVSIVGAILLFLLILFILLALRDYVDRFVNSISDVIRKRIKRFMIFGIIAMVGSILMNVIAIREFNAYNVLYEAGGFEINESGEFIYGKEAYMLFISSISILSVSTIVFGGLEIAYLVSMIVCLSFINKLSKILPLDSQNDPFYQTNDGPINVESTEKKEETVDPFDSNFRDFK